MFRSPPWLLLLAITFVTVQNDVPPSQCSAELSQLIAEGSCAELDRPEFTGYRQELTALYALSDNRPVWVHNGRVTYRGLEMMEMLRSADKKGLDPLDYDGPRWSGRLSSFRQNGRAVPEGALARFDVALSVCIMRYISDLHFGRVDPGLYRLGGNIESQRRRLPSMVYQQVVNAEDLQTAIERIEPPFEGYRRTLRALQQYRSLIREERGEILPSTIKPVDPGQLYLGTPGLVRILRTLGDLAFDAELPSNPELYSGTVVEALKRFQSRHGLETDARIGKATLAELNTPLIRRVRQLELTLERWRWVPHYFSRPPIVVNLPEFRLRAYNSLYRPELEMKIVAGGAHRHQTPVFAGELRYVVLRPYWNVPLSIQRAELVPRIRRDRSYLAKNHYELVTPQGTVLTQDFVYGETLEGLRTGRFLMRQKPGPDNALGLVKFIFPNEHNMYLHDTPARALFERSRRDFSHGCMRVERAEDLAVWVLQEEPGWPRDRVIATLNGSKTIQVNLKQPIPVLVVYGTAVVLENGEVRFLQDIYGYDAILEKYLAARIPPSGSSSVAPASPSQEADQSAGNSRLRQVPDTRWSQEWDRMAAASLGSGGL